MQVSGVAGFAVTYELLHSQVTGITDCIKTPRRLNPGRCCADLFIQLQLRYPICSCYYAQTDKIRHKPFLSACQRMCELARDCSALDLYPFIQACWMVQLIKLNLPPETDMSAVTVAH